MSKALKTIAAVAIFSFAAGCANMKTLESEVASLRTQVGTLQADVDDGIEAVKPHVIELARLYITKLR